MDESVNLGDLSDELSAKVAQMQALLAEETSNVGGVVLDADTLARLEETYNSSSDEEEEVAAPKPGATASRATATKIATPATDSKRKTSRKTTVESNKNVSKSVSKSVSEPATGITARRGRPKGARGRARARGAPIASGASARAARVGSRLGDHRASRDDARGERGAARPEREVWERCERFHEDVLEGYRDGFAAQRRAGG